MITLLPTFTFPLDHTPAVHASSHPIYKDHYDRTKARLGRQRGAKVARIEAEAIWHMLQTDSMFAPARPHAVPLVALTILV
jgi:hypothetical protein